MRVTLVKRWRHGAGEAGVWCGVAGRGLARKLASRSAVAALAVGISLLLAKATLLAQGPPAERPGRGVGREDIEGLMRAAGVLTDAPGDAAANAARRAREDGPSVELRVRWRGARAGAPGQAGQIGLANQPGPPTGPNGEPSIGAFDLTATRASGEAMPRERLPELAETKLLIAAVGAAGRLRSWALVNDPRVIRAEFPGGAGANPNAGELRGTVLEVPEAELLIALPQDADSLELRIYHPRWTGDAFRLEQIGRVALR